MTDAKSKLRDMTDAKSKSRDMTDAKSKSVWPSRVAGRLLGTVTRGWARLG